LPAFLAGFFVDFFALATFFFLPAASLGRGLLALLAADGALGARHIAILVDEVDVVVVHLESAVGYLLGLALGQTGLLSSHAPDGAVLDVKHVVLVTRDSQLCDFFSHFSALRQKKVAMRDVAS
jgi:hypothetical protein